MLAIYIVTSNVGCNVFRLLQCRSRAERSGMSPGLLHASSSFSKSTSYSAFRLSSPNRIFAIISTPTSSPPRPPSCRILPPMPPARHCGNASAAFPPPPPLPRPLSPHCCPELVSPLARGGAMSPSLPPRMPPSTSRAPFGRTRRHFWPRPASSPRMRRFLPQVNLATPL